MLDGLRSVAGGDSALPFVLQFYGNPSSYLWDDDQGETHEIMQGEGGEQGDPLMPMLYALGQHQALRSVQSQLLHDERLLAFHDDIYVVSQPERTVEIHDILREDLWDYSRIQIHAGKTQIWNRGGHIPTNHDTLLRAAQVEDPEAQIWFGSLEAPPEERGIKVLGTPLGTAAFVRSRLQSTVEHHRLLLGRIPAIQDLQSAWLLLLFCASSRATYHLRVCHPEFAAPFARQHDIQVWECLATLLGHTPPQSSWELASLPMHMGGLGLRSAARVACAAHWGSWADCLHTVAQRHENIAHTMAEALSSPPVDAVHIGGAVASRRQLATIGYDCPDWASVLEGARPRQPNLDEVDPGVPTHGWQFFAAQAVEQRYRTDVVWPRLSTTEQALLRSQLGPMSGLPFSSVPSSPPTRFAPQLFRVLLLRRLWLALPFSSRTCRCGRPLDVLGHHRAACSRAGVLGSRGFSLESAAARVCREAGVRVSTNLFVRDLDLPIANHDARRLEVVADGLPLFGGAQLAIDTTLVSSVQADGRPRPQCARVDGAALSEARRRKQRTYPELSGTQGRARLVVLAAEVGGRWSDEARAFVSQLAKAKARAVPRVLAGRARQAWQHRWSSMLACAAARAFALSLLDKRPALGSDGDTPPLLTLLLRAATYRSAPRCEPGLVV